MTLYHGARCPQCQTPVPLAGFWKRAPKDRGGLFLIGRVGVACPACRARLRVLQSSLVTAVVGSFAALCAAFGALGAVEHAQLGAARQDLNLLLIALAIVGWMILFRRYGYRFARLRVVEDGEKVAVFSLFKPMVEQRKGDDRPDQPAIEVGAPLQAATQTPARCASEKPAWICPECEEQNPGRYDICCICETHRDAGEP